MTNEFLLQDRLQKIRQVVGQYGEENFFISFSGGKDSTVLSALVDMALPGNRIPRVFANTGIEYKLILDFVEREKEREHPWELVVLKPTVPIKTMLEKEGYPFKSKVFSTYVNRFRKSGNTKSVLVYAGKHEGKSWSPQNSCPAKLQYLFTEGHEDFPISAKCCDKMKKEPLKRWQRENGKTIIMIGVMQEEGGGRQNAKCVVYDGDKLKFFQPLVPVTKEWEDWLIGKYNVDVSDICKPPYNLSRTGCKGCPFALRLQNELDTLEKYFPNERKQCEIIWKPVYDEYRRLGYRLKPNRIDGGEA